MQDILHLQEKFQDGKVKEQTKQFAVDKSLKIQLDLTLSTDRLRNMSYNENKLLYASTQQLHYFERLSPMMKKEKDKIDIKNKQLLELSGEGQKGISKKLGGLKLEKIDFSQMMSQKYQRLMEQKTSKTTRDYDYKNNVYQLPEQNYNSNQSKERYFQNQDFTHVKAPIRKKAKQLSDIVVTCQTEDNNQQNDAYFRNKRKNTNSAAVGDIEQTEEAIQKDGLNSEYTSQFWKVKQIKQGSKNIMQNNQQQSQNQNSPCQINKHNKHHQSNNKEMNIYSQNTFIQPQKYNLNQINLKVPQKQKFDFQIDSDYSPSPTSPNKFHKIFQSSSNDVKKDFAIKAVTQNSNITRSYQSQINSFSSLPYDFQPPSLAHIGSSQHQNLQGKVEHKSNLSLKQTKSSPFLLTFSSKFSSSPTTKSSSPSKKLNTFNNFSSAVQLDQPSPSNANNSQQKGIFHLPLNKSNSEQQPLNQQKHNIHSIISKNTKNLKNSDSLGLLGSFLNIQKVQVDDTDLKININEKISKKLSSKNNNIIISNNHNNDLKNNQNVTNNNQNTNNNNNNGQLLTPSTQTASFFQKSPILSCTSEVQQLTPISKMQRPSLILQKIENFALLDSPQLNSQPFKHQQSIIIEEELNLNADFSFPQSPLIKAEKNRERKVSIMKDSIDREFKKRSSICKESLSPVYRRNYSKIKSMTDESLILDSISLTSSPLTHNSKSKAREASFILESKLEEIKQHLLTQFQKEQELNQIVEEFCLIKGHEFINEIIRFLKYTIECYNKKKIIESQAEMYQSNTPSHENQQNNNNNNHNINTCGHNHHHLMMDDNQNGNTMKFQIIPKILLDWVIHELFQKMKSWKIDGDNLFAYLVELAINHLLPHNLYEELGSEIGIKNWIKLILEKLQQIVVIETRQINDKLDQLYQIVVNIIHNNFSSVSSLFTLFQMDFNFTSIEFYLLKQVFIESFSLSHNKAMHSQSIKGNQTICQLIDFYSKNASKEVIVEDHGYVNSYIKNEILTRIEICRNILLNVTQPLKEDKIITAISIFLNSLTGFNKQGKSSGQTLKTIENFIRELCFVFYQNKEKRETFLLFQKTRFVENYDKSFWQNINLAFEKVMENKLNEDFHSKHIQIDINLQLYLLEIESYQLENKQYQSVFDYIQNVQELIHDLFLYIEELYFNLGENFQVDVILALDRSFMSFFLETALSPGSYSSTDIYQAFLYKKISKQLFNFWMKALQQVLESNKYQLNHIQQRDLLTFLYNIAPL